MLNLINQVSSGARFGQHGSDAWDDTAAYYGRGPLTAVEVHIGMTYVGHAGLRGIRRRYGDTWTETEGEEMSERHLLELAEGDVVLELTGTSIVATV